MADPSASSAAAGSPDQAAASSPATAAAAASDSSVVAAAQAQPPSLQSASSYSVPSGMSRPQSLADPSLSAEQLRAKKLFDRWQKTFLGAIDKQSEEYVLAMLREGEDLLARGTLDLNRAIKPASGSTFLHTAAWFQKARVLEWLLEHGADPNQANLKGNTPLHLLAEQAAPDNRAGAAVPLIQCMLDYGGDVHQKDASGLDPVDKAKAVGFDILTLNFEAGKQFMARKEAAAAAAAAAGGDANGAAAQQLQRMESTRAGAAGGSGTPDVDGDSGGESGSSGGEFAPLSESERAAAASKAALVYRKLSTLFMGLEAEGVSQAVDDAIVRILHANMHLVHHQLLELGRAPPDAAGRTFLHLAVAARRPEIVRVLLLALTRNASSTPDTQDDAGDTALHLAVQRLEEEGGAAVVALLLDAGASKTITNYLRGLTPFQMLPATASPESKRWLLDYKPQVNIPPANALTAKMLAGGAAAAGGASGAGSVPIAGFGSASSSGTFGSASPERQDRAGARALMARLASSVNSGAAAALAAGSGVEGLSAARSSALGLIKGSGAAGAGGAGGGAGLNARGSGGGVLFGGALASILAKNLGGGPGATGAKVPLPAGLASAVARARGSGHGLGGAAGGPLGLGLGGKKGAGVGLGHGGAVSDHRRLLIDELFDVLDLGSTHSLPAAQVGALHSSLHGGCACPPAIVQQALDSASPPGSCTRANLLEVLAQLDLACTAHQALRWDFALLDFDGLGALSTAESSGAGAPAYASAAELVWQVNHADPAQTKFEDFMARKFKSEKARPKDVKWVEMQTELVGKMHNFG